MSLDLSTDRLSRKAQRKILVVWLAMAALGLAALHTLTSREQERDRHQWEIRLGLVATAHAKAVGGWVEERIAALHNLADNVSLKLYLTELTYAARGDSDITTEPAELTYLRNLLIASADLGGFSAPLPDTAGIGANIAPKHDAGILIADATFKPVVSTHAMPPLEKLPQSLQQPTQIGDTLSSPVFALTDDKPAIAFRLPIYGVQQDNTSAPIGYIFAVALLNDAFYDLLTSIASEETTAESLLLEPDGEKLHFISPLQDGKKPLTLTVDKNSSLASVNAALAPEALVEGTDYRSTQSLAVAHPVDGTPWLLAHKIDTAVAMRETNSRAFFLYVAYVLGVAALTAGATALWRSATTHRAKQVAAHYKSLSHRIQKQEALLELIAETTPIATYIVDEEGKYRYANRRAAEEAEMDRTAMPGRGLETVLGRKQAIKLLAASHAALEAGKPQQLMQRDEENGQLRQAHQTRHIPLESVPLPEENNETVRGVLVIDQDITDVVRGEERRARTLQQLIDTLVEMVDRRDPHAARHSACVTLLAREVGKQMQLDDQLNTAAEIAGQLMNIGKIAVPETLLTAKDVLKDKDRERIRTSILASVDLLEGIDFDSPVVETLRQSLTKNPSLASAQIIAAANDFVAMISPRAWRGSMAVDDAIAEMLKQAGKRYERAVVAALVNYMDNAGGRHAVEALLKAAA